MHPSCCWSLFSSTAPRFAQPGDRLRVVKAVSSCCGKIDSIVEVVRCSSRGDLTIKCPVFGEHEFGYAYNTHFEFVDQPVIPKPPPNEIGATHWAECPDKSVIFYKIEGSSIQIWYPISKIWTNPGIVPYNLFCFGEDDES